MKVIVMEKEKDNIILVDKDLDKQCFSISKIEDNEYIGQISNYN